MIAKPARIILVVAALSLTACGGPEGTDPQQVATTTAPAVGSTDAGVPPLTTPDAGSVDAGAPSTPSPTDAGSPDADAGAPRHRPAPGRLAEPHHRRRGGPHRQPTSFTGPPLRSPPGLMQTTRRCCWAGVLPPSPTDKALRCAPRRWCCRPPTGLAWHSTPAAGNPAPTRLGTSMHRWFSLLTSAASASRRSCTAGESLRPSPTAPPSLMADGLVGPYQRLCSCAAVTNKFKFPPLGAPGVHDVQPPAPTSLPPRLGGAAEANGPPRTRRPDPFLVAAAGGGMGGDRGGEGSPPGRGGVWETLRLAQAGGRAMAVRTPTGAGVGVGTRRRGATARPRGPRGPPPGPLEYGAVWSAGGARAGGRRAPGERRPGDPRRASTAE